MLDTNPGRSDRVSSQQFRGQRGERPDALARGARSQRERRRGSRAARRGSRQRGRWANALGIQFEARRRLVARARFLRGRPLRDGRGVRDASHRAACTRLPCSSRASPGPMAETFRSAAQPPARRVMGEAEAYLTTSLLSSVVDHGTAAAARTSGAPGRR